MFKICITGCGSISTSMHGPSLARYAAEHADTELAACCDLDADRARTYAERFGFGAHYVDMHAMLEKERPNALVIVVPVEHTCRVVCDAVPHGVPILLEKPPGLTTAETDRMIAAARENDLEGRVQVAFNRRYAPLAAALRDQIEARTIRHIRYEMVRVGRRDPDFSTTAIHGVDTVRFFAGSDYAEVRFRYNPYPELGEGVADIFMDAIMNSGATAHLAFCPVAGFVAERAVVHTGDRSFWLGVPLWDSIDGDGILRGYERNALKVEIEGSALSGAEPHVKGGFYGEDAAFFDAVRAGKPVTPTLSEARQSVAVAQAMRERKDHVRT
jgi:predicted dehydrogenase